MRKSLLNVSRAFIAALGALFMLVVLVPGQANAVSTADIHVYVDPGLSQSNMLFSHESNVSYTVGQTIVAEGKCGGEGGNCTYFSWAEPLNGWVNGGWCAGFQAARQTTYSTVYGDWHYYSGGSGGKSVNLIYDVIKPHFPVDQAGLIRVKSYLVPHGVAGCVAR